MYLSIFDIFKIGIGPSSSHTVGPMKAALFFVKALKDKKLLDATERIVVELYGSLSYTKTGHGTDLALQLGLLGIAPDEVDSNKIFSLVEKIKEDKKIKLNGEKEIDFDAIRDIQSFDIELKRHSNTLRIKAFDKNEKLICEEECYSVGGGFVEFRSEDSLPISNDVEVKYNFSNWKELEVLTKEKNKEVWEIVLENEKSFRKEERVNEKIDRIYTLMQECVDKSFDKTEVIRGGMNLPRRAKKLLENYNKSRDKNPLDLVFIWGIAASEENASYGRVITAPTNGAAGLIPSVLKYCKEFYKITPEEIRKFLLTAGAVGYLCKRNASISGAEGGCQAEIGSACAMAAAGLTAVLGGNCRQIESAAIMALSNNLGLTCDPVGGLVLIPCIERNGVKAVEAVSCGRVAILEEGSNFLNLDAVIKTMKETGDDMLSKYKETSQGGLAKNCPVDRCKTCNLCSKNTLCN